MTTTPTPLLLSDFVNNCIRDAKRHPRPRPLFGEFWHDGELAVLFAGAGRGKSVLATQIAESIARGRPFGPFRTTREPQKVGYVDLEKSDQHWEMRYSADTGEKAQFARKHYLFSSNFVRIRLDVAAACSHGSRLVDELLTAIEAKIREHDLKVVVLDSITFLRRTSRGTREMLTMMLGLSRLRYELGVSVLVLARTQRDDRPRPLSIDEMRSATIVCDIADSVFAVGQDFTDASARYIKQLRSRNGDLIYDAPHVPVFTLKKIGGTFLGFEFAHFTPERELLTDIREHREWETINQIKQMSDSGTRIRDIAEQLSLTKTKTHRLLQMWRPPKGHLTAETRRRGEKERVEKEGPSWEELSAEESRCIYLKRRGEDASVPAGRSVPPALAGGFFTTSSESHQTAELISPPKRSQEGGFTPAPIPDKNPEPEIIETPFRHTTARPDVLDNFAGTSRTDDPYAEFVEVEIQYDPNEPPADQPRPKFVRLHKTLNDYDKEIFVERYNNIGQREIWYQINRQGLTTRSVRTNGTIYVTYVVNLGSQVKWKPPGQAGQDRNAE